VPAIASPVLKYDVQFQSDLMQVCQDIGSSMSLIFILPKSLFNVVTECFACPDSLSETIVTNALAFSGRLFISRKTTCPYFVEIVNLSSAWKPETGTQRVLISVFCQLWVRFSHRSLGAVFF
jgi:hypothetical protein